MKLVRLMGQKGHRVADFRVLKHYSGTAKKREVEVIELRQTGRHDRKYKKEFFREEIQLWDILL